MHIRCKTTSAAVRSPAVQLSAVDADNECEIRGWPRFCNFVIFELIVIDTCREREFTGHRP